MHLGIGKVHACHHPFAHKVDVSALSNNENVLFNTDVLKAARKEMLNGQRPAECNYCWRIEDNNTDMFSDRHYKSADYWALKDFDDIAKLTGDEDIYPSYLEVSFANTCNLKCLYCGPEYSSKWADEIKRNGAISLLEGTSREVIISGGFSESAVIKNRDHNPYTDAFWKWFPQAFKHLTVLRITGGEPLLSKDLFKLLDWFEQNPSPNLEFCINSNFNVDNHNWDRFLKKLLLLKQSNTFREIKLYTSVEAWGERAEYIRTGLDFEMLKCRIVQCLENGIRVDIMAALNILSLTSYYQLLEWVILQKRTFNKLHKIALGIDTSHVDGFDFLDTVNATQDIFAYFEKTEEMAKHNVHTGDNLGLEVYEYDRLRQVVSTYRRDAHTVSKDSKIKFFDFIDTMDKRNNTHFVKVFPEYSEFYNLCYAEKISDSGVL
jgi:organic radical activating enzyme